MRADRGQRYVGSGKQVTTMNGLGMAYSDEVEIKQALGIDSWRNLSKDKVIQFASMMPDMDTEVAIKIIEQFPVFKDFAVDVVDSMEKAHEATLSANTTSQERVHQAFQEIREILKGELNKDDLSFEEKKYLIEQIQETGRQEFQKDSENKQFLDGVLNKVFAGAGGVLTDTLVDDGGDWFGDHELAVVVIHRDDDDVTVRSDGAVGGHGVVCGWAWVCPRSPGDSARQGWLDRGKEPPAGDHRQDLPRRGLEAQPASVGADRHTQRLQCVTEQGPGREDRGQHRVALVGPHGRRLPQPLGSTGDPAQPGSHGVRGHVQVGRDRPVSGARMVGQQSRHDDLDGVGTSRRHLGREQHMGGRATAAACPPGAHRHPGPTKTA